MAPIAGAAILEIIKRVGDKFFPDPVQKAEFDLKAAEMAQRGEFKDIDSMLTSDNGQVLINVEEAKSDDIWKSGWRPGAGWVCVFGLAYQFLVQPLGSWLATNALDWSAAPTLEMESLMTLLFGVLGLGYYRTRERLSGKIQ